MVIGWIVVAVIFALMGKMVWENWVQVQETDFTLRLFPLLSSTLIFALSYFIQVWAWYLISVKLRIALPFPDTLKSWFFSQFGKYVPGKIWLLLGRLYFYGSRGRSRTAVSVGLYLETASMIMAALLLFLISLLFFKEVPLRLDGRQWGVAGLLSLGILISLHPRVLQKILNGILIRLKREPLALALSYWDVLRVVFVCILAWGIGGIGFYLFVDSVLPVSLRHILFLAGSLAFSSTLGLIALFAPGGLGVREGALVFLLSAIMPPSVAVVVSILTRLWMTLIEIGLTGMIYLYDLFGKRDRKGNVHG
jgi:uncharacterized membrane protein YbhN (UPF0104 family)